MTGDRQSREATAEDLRGIAAAMAERANDDVLVWLEQQGTLAAADRYEAFKAGENVRANKLDDLCTRFAQAGDEFRKLRLFEQVSRDLLVARLEVALKAARAPDWRPTHRHYKGGLYRFLGQVRDANHEELSDGVVYDDRDGNRYFLLRSRFESLLESGRPRYEILSEDIMASIMKGEVRAAKA